MELVYLWVEDYKNIHKQGFNFSPKFTCNYDEKTNKLTIDTNDDYIENFFGDNINVTAIVGKNGSGKSNVLSWLLTNLIELNENKYLLLFKKTKKQNNTFDIDTNIISSNNFNIKKSFLLNYKYLDSSYGYSNSNDSFFKNDITKQRKTIVDNTNEYNLSTTDKLFIAHIEYNKLISEFDSKYMFDEFVITMNYQELPTNFHQINTRKYSKILEKLKVWNDMYDTNIIQVFQGYNTFQFFIEWITENNPKYDLTNMLDNLLKCDSLDEYLSILAHELENFDTVEINELYNKLLQLPQIIQNNLNMQELYKNFTFENNVFTIRLQLSDERKIENIINSTRYLNREGLNFISYDFKNKENQTSYSDLSDGERQIITICINLITSLDSTRNKNSVIILDEIDSYLHPSWNREILSILLRIINKFIDNHKNIFIHLLFTTHSPFLLSDIPKQNIIFLDTDEEGKCMVVDGLKEKKQTFGANIHTLLSDSFFMEDGLMGEFAKGKIDKAIGLLNKDSLSDDELKYCEQIISIIGEPIVKNQLQRMLDSKKISYLARDTKEEIEFLKQRIDLLSKRL